MTRRTEFILLTTLVIATRIGDGVATYLVTPDLGRALNPLAKGGWIPLITAATIIIGASTILNYRQLFHPIDNFPTARDADLAQFKKALLQPSVEPPRGIAPASEQHSYVRGH